MILLYEMVEMFEMVEIVEMVDSDRMSYVDGMDGMDSVINLSIQEGDDTDKRITFLHIMILFLPHLSRLSR